jgi:hypothetical protein
LISNQETVEERERNEKIEASEKREPKVIARK